MPLRRVPHCLRVFWAVLAIALVSLCAPSRARSKEGTPVSAARVVSDVPPAPADFDGDRVLDPLTLERTGWRLSVEISLSRTRDVAVLAADPSLPVNGSLTARDLDNDGDTDLLWKGASALAPPAVAVWFNDGSGHFAPLLARRAPQTEPPPKRSLRKEALRVGPHYEALSSERLPSPVSFVAVDRIEQGGASKQRKPLTVVPVTQFLTRPPSDRAPPVLH
jgi:hypothetical protein